MTEVVGMTRQHFGDSMKFSRDIRSNCKRLVLFSSLRLLNFLNFIFGNAHFSGRPSLPIQGALKAYAANAWAADAAMPGMMSFLQHCEKNDEIVQKISNVLAKSDNGLPNLEPPE